jgi:hypothetical protein
LWRIGRADFFIFDKKIAIGLQVAGDPRLVLGNQTQGAVECKKVSGKQYSLYQKRRHRRKVQDNRHGQNKRRTFGLKTRRRANVAQYGILFIFFLKSLG